jgi:hypothetical protein
MRSYLVLRRDGNTWAVVTTVKANGAATAVRRVVVGRPRLPGVSEAERYAAVPIRNWTEITAVVEPVEPRVRLERRENNEEEQ